MSSRTAMTAGHYFWAFHRTATLEPLAESADARFVLVPRRSVLSNPLWPLRSATSHESGATDRADNAPLLPRRERVTPSTPLPIFKDVARVGTTHGTGVELPDGVAVDGFVSVLGDSTKRFWENASELKELSVLEQVTVARTAGERLHSKLSHKSIQKAIAAMNNHGICILRETFDADSIRSVSGAGQKDLTVAERRLKERGIDIRNPANSTKFNDNFVELAMREPRRCDMHRSPHLLAINRKLEQQVAAQNTGQTKRVPAPKPWVSKEHPDVLRVLQEVCHPPGGALAAGNWGRWNFGGPGPGGPPDALKTGDVGVIFSFPGAADQTFHADTPHLFDHVQLPPHYVDLFMPHADGAADAAGGDSALGPYSLDLEPCLRNFKVGQTGFISGSHLLEVSARVCYHDKSSVARKEYYDSTSTKNTTVTTMAVAVPLTTRVGCVFA